jgi:hypothetical protein
MAGMNDIGGPRNKGELVLLAAAALWFLALAGRGVNVMDEGVQLLHGFQTARGLVIYRDYLVPAAPLGFFIQAGLIKLFGVHLIVGRLYAAAQGLIVVAVALRLGRRRLRPPFALVPAALWVFFTIGLGNFPHYNLDSAFFLTLALAAMDDYLDRPRRRTLFLGAVLASLSILSKQSMALAAAPLPALAVWLAGPEGGNRPRRLLLAAAGLVLPGLPFLFYLASNHALLEAWQVLTGLGDMKRLVLLAILPPAAALLTVTVSLLGLLVAATRRRPELAAPLWGLVLVGSAALVIATRSLVIGSLVVATVALALTIMAATRRRPELAAPLWGLVLVGSAALVIATRSLEIASLVTAIVAVSLAIMAHPAPADDPRPWLLLRVTWLLYFLATILSGLDLGHVLLASVGSVFFAGLALQRIWMEGERNLKRVAAAGLLAILAAGVYLDLALPQLARSQSPRWQAVVPIRLPGMEGMRASAEQARDLENTVGYIRSHTAPGERIFVYPWDLILYVMAERLPATYHTSFYYEMVNQAALRRVFSDLEKNRPPLAVAAMEGNRFLRVAFDAEAGPMEEYLTRHYRTVARYGRYQLMARIVTEPGAGGSVKGGPDEK